MTPTTEPRNKTMKTTMKTETNSKTEKAEILEIKKLAAKYCRRKHINLTFAGIVRKDVYGNLCAELRGNIYGNVFLSTLSHLRLVTGKKILAARY